MNYKRKKARVKGQNSKPYWSHGTPEHWHILFHRRPKRRANQILLKTVLAGADPDAVAWPLGNCKPHLYYW